jgi:hypothetical protein
MIQAITVEREYGTQGAVFARQLAEHLGWELFDQSLVEEVARRAKVPAAVVKSRDEQLDPWYNKVGRAFWHGSNERATTAVEQEILDATRMTGLFQEVMEEKARAGKCVIVGRGAACALHGVPGCFHVFVYASMARKIRWFEQAFPDKAHLAERELLATDRRRAEYVEHFYHNVWNDYRLYHLMLNACMGFEAMIGATIEATGI